MGRKKLSKKDVLHLAKLAGLTLTEDEAIKYKKQLKETISYIENLEELETTKIPPTSHSISITDVFFEDGEKNERLFSLKEVFQNTKNKENNCFKVKKIFE